MSRTAADFYYGSREDLGLPYDRYYCEERNCWIRVETNGRGGTVEIREPGEPLTFGLGLSASEQMRARFGRMDALKENSGWTLGRIAAEALAHLQAHGPMTREDLADQLRVWTHQVNHALTDLKRKAEVHCYPHPDAGGRKYLWAPGAPGV